MKKVFLIVLIAITSLSIYSCSKNTETKDPSSSENSLFRSSEDPVIATFEEDEYEMATSKAALFGYSSITISAGEYKIRKDLSTGKFYCILNIKDLGTLTTEEPLVYEGGVRIVKRNLCKHHHKSCCCPLGFRCGWTNAPAGGLTDDPSEGSSNEPVSSISTEEDITAQVDSQKSQLVIVFNTASDSRIFEEKK